MKNKDADTKLNSGSDIHEMPHETDLNDNESNDAPVDLRTPRTSQPTRNAAIAARSMLKLWLDPDDDNDDDDNDDDVPLLGSVADHARN